MGLIGIDEVGRGCWAGPLVVVGVRLDSVQFPGLKDSKGLTKQKRFELTQEIKAIADDIAISWTSASIIDEIGLTEAMKHACQSIYSSLFKEGDDIIIDGMVNYLSEVPECTTLVKGDEKVPAIAAASIVAKVARDTYMEQADYQYPGYNFGAHVGYGTKAHMEALSTLGICTLHRRSFKPIKRYE